MDFAIAGAFLPTDELVPIARAADELGYAGFAIADHVVDLETIATPYPYEADGSRRWDHATEWPDPWVLVGALSAVTTRLTFFTSIYVAALRSPYQVAKSVGTAAVLSGGRVRLGVGVGWCREEFDLLGQDFATRGRRTDEALELVDRLWSDDWVESGGPLYPTPRLTMRPRPEQRVPILVGGMSEVALRRAARHDGWIGDVCSTEDAIGFAKRLRELRAELGREGDPAVVVALNDALTRGDFARAEAGGITDVMTMPWLYYHGFQATLEQKIDGMRRFADDVLDR
ncbi:TIGR03619 family F420-dependent LLM class oxidoreductase [Nocardioides pocheonensis]|uniref:TIGR03619 family F420-dependent LLM class oxidoreductase n=1 Tax=Nocardioides pocheonensis TaxID=661485 RepID=A0A3N0GKR5_9ACTN|nr:TIGR03619 family F420-dependent LLM class oxidoreductase [Nocardioides pocheonensis]RNM13077.1 TIGR03619 family F420-dependent LLM class oxidoreductase [Nocardioides pocheonensis]